MSSAAGVGEAAAVVGVRGTASAPSSSGIARNRCDGAGLVYEAVIGYRKANAVFHDIPVGVGRKFGVLVFAFHDEHGDRADHRAGNPGERQPSEPLIAPLFR